MITCSRCGKENQDLYKFCLGCGAKLQAGAVPAHKPAPVPDNYPLTPPPEAAVAPIGSAKVAVPQPPESVASAGSAPLPISTTPPPDFASTSPIQGLGVTPPPLVVSPPAAAPVAPAPVVPAALAPSPASPHPSAPTSVPSVQIGIGSIPMQVPARQSPLGVGAISAPSSWQPTPAAATVVPPVQVPHSSPFSPPPTVTVACPNCGKQVASAFAFCGGCGHRMKAAPGAAAEAASHPAEVVAPQPVRLTPRGHLTLIRPDGTEGGVLALQEGENLIGRGQGAIFDADPYLSPHHAEFFLNEGSLEVRDHRSLNGVFVRITGEEPLQSGDCFRIGQELLRFDVINPVSPLEDGTEIIGTPNPGYWGRLSVVVGRDLDGPAFPLFDETARLGRERGDILFPEDGYVSGAHCELTAREDRVFLKDLGSSNGTFLRVRESRIVPSGSLMLMGQQLFRVAYK